MWLLAPLAWTRMWLLEALAWTRIDIGGFSTKIDIWTRIRWRGPVFCRSLRSRGPVCPAGMSLAWTRMFLAWTRTISPPPPPPIRGGPINRGGGGGGEVVKSLARSAGVDPYVAARSAGVDPYVAARSAGVDPYRYWWFLHQNRYLDPNPLAWTRILSLAPLAWTRMPSWHVAGVDPYVSGVDPYKFSPPPPPRLIGLPLTFRLKI